MTHSTVEVEWDDTERDWMLALQHYRDTHLCQLCGLPKKVCRDINTDGNVVVDEQRCHITAAILAKQRARLQDEAETAPQSMAYTATLRPPQ